MKLIIFGANGGTGRQCVEQALEQGHTVTAFVRSPIKFKLQHACLQILEGNVTEPAAVERAVKNHDVVLSAIGAPAANKNAVRSDGTRNIIGAMEKAGIKRFISVSTFGVGDSREMLPFLYKFILVPLFLRRAFADHEIQEKYIKQSRLDWIIVRPTALTNENRTGAYRHGFPLVGKNLKNKISRADVADFMLKQMTDNAYLHKTPGLSY